jgi:hypothetical protein
LAKGKSYEAPHYVILSNFNYFIFLGPKYSPEHHVKIEARTYVVLMEKDVIKFGFSSHEYVLLHEDSRVEQ